MRQLLLLLLISSWLAATLSGAAGFGGALLLLPVLANVVGVKAAVPILTIAQLFGNGSRAWFGRRELQWQPILYFIAGAVPFSVLGGWLFAGVPARYVTRVIGLLLIGIVLYRRLRPGAQRFGCRGMAAGGALTGFLSGLAGSAGPLGAAFFIGLNLSPVAYVASEAFTAVTMHLTKIVVYGRYSLVGGSELRYGILLGLAMVLGSWTGKKIIERLKRERFVLVVEALLVLAGLQLLFALH